MTQARSAPSSFMAPGEFLAHWQGHRRLTRRVVSAFPEDELFGFSVGGMRSFGEMTLELLGMGAPMVRGVAEGVWNWSPDRDAVPQSELLERWDAATREIDQIWPGIPEARFHETLTAFGQWEGTAYEHFLYAMDNEVHHRGQGYVYLRALGVEPPPFWERD